MYSSSANAPPSRGLLRSRIAGSPTMAPQQDEHEREFALPDQGGHETSNRESDAYDDPGHAATLDGDSEQAKPGPAFGSIAWLGQRSECPPKPGRCSLGIQLLMRPLPRAWASVRNVAPSGQLTSFKLRDLRGGHPRWSVAVRSSISVGAGCGRPLLRPACAPNLRHAVWRWPASGARNGLRRQSRHRRTSLLASRSEKSIRVDEHGQPSRGVTHRQRRVAIWLREQWHPPTGLC